MFFIYILRSEKNNKRYVGYTSKRVQQRLAEHNAGRTNKWTRQNRPFKLLPIDKIAGDNNIYSIEVNFDCVREISKETKFNIYGIK